MPQSVIDRLNAKAKGQPSHPVFMDRLGNAIGNIPFDVDCIETVELDVELPGVHIPEVGEYDEIPRVDPAQELELPEPYVDVGVILTFLHLKNYLWLNWSQWSLSKSLSKPTTVFTGQLESASSQLIISLP